MLRPCVVLRFDLCENQTVTRGSEERLKAASQQDLRPTTSAKFLDHLVAHPLVASNNSDIEVTAMACCKSAISRLHAVPSAHVRNPGCRYDGVFINCSSAALVFQLGSVMRL